MKRILLVEDDLSLINGLSFAVKKQGYQLDVAHTSSEADSLWEAGRYDLVILDVTLPDGSGFDICRNIRKTSKVPIMFLTAMDEETELRHMRWIYRRWHAEPFIRLSAKLQMKTIQPVCSL